MNRILSVFVSTAMSLAVAACSFNVANSRAEANGLSLKSIENIQWTLRAWNIDEPISQASKVTLVYQNGKFIGHGGCNRYFAAVTESAIAGNITVAIPGATRMLCRGTQSQVEARYFKLLATVKKVELITGRLALTYKNSHKTDIMLFHRMND